MIDIVALRENSEPYIESLERRSMDSSVVSSCLSVDASWREQKGVLDSLRAEKNQLSQKINEVKKTGADLSSVLKEAKELPARIAEQELRVQELEEKRDALLRKIPNILADQVPKGASEEENVQRNEFGQKRVFSFPPKSHVEIIESLGVVDFDASRKTSGSGFFFLKGSLALLDQALQQYAIDIMLKHNFELIVPPYMLRKSTLDGVIDTEEFAHSIFSLQDKDLHLISTSEHSLVGLLTQKDIPAQELPVRLVGISPCFRAEVGSHGIDEKGLFRTHQFHKVEQIIVCTPEESTAWFERLLAITTEIFTSLEIPIRHLEMCTGDLGMMKHRQFDIEAWSPRKNGYFEVGSCSNLTDMQARRLGIRMLLPDGSRVVAHTLNNTALATSRAMVALIENFQQEDGTVLIPRVLHPYMRGVTKLS